MKKRETAPEQLCHVFDQSSLFVAQFSDDTGVVATHQSCVGTGHASSALRCLRWMLLVGGIGVLLFMTVAPASAQTNDIDYAAVAWSSDGARLATIIERVNGEPRSTLMLIDLVLRRRLVERAFPGVDLNSVDFSPDGTRIAVSADLNSPNLVVDSETLVTQLEMPNTWVASEMRYSPDGALIAAAYIDNADPAGMGALTYSVRLWNAETGAFIADLTGHSDAIRIVRWSPDGATLLSAGDDNRVLLWRRGQWSAPLLTINEPGVMSAAWSLDGTRFATVNYDMALRIRQMGQQDASATFELPGRLPSEMVWGADDSLIAVGIEGALITLDATSGALQERASLMGSFDARITGLAFSPDSENIVYTTRVFGDAPGALVVLTVGALAAEG